MNVVFYEVFAEEEEALKKFLPKEIQATFHEGVIQSYGEKNPPSPVISIRTQSNIPKSWENSLEAIFTRSSGYDHLQEWIPLQKKGLKLGYLPDYCATAVAEHAMLLLLALLKKLKKQLKNFEAFNRNGLTGKNCQKRNLLIIGVGKIGREIARIAQGIGMNVKGVDLVQREENISYVTLEEGLKNCDCIICALPLTEKTDHLLNYETLKNVPEGSIFVNISRGEISPLPDLARLLNEDILSGIGLDVYEHESELAKGLREKKETNNPELALVCQLKEQDNVIFTPHNAFNSMEGLENKAKYCAMSLQALLKTGFFVDTL